MSIAVFCGLVIFVLLAVMLLAGVPIAIALAVSSICAILPVLNLGASVLTGAQRIFSGISVFSLLAIPFFILAGNIMNKGGIAIRLINFAKLFTGSIPEPWPTPMPWPTCSLELFPAPVQRLLLPWDPSSAPSRRRKDMTGTFPRQPTLPLLPPAF